MQNRIYWIGLQSKTIILAECSFLFVRIWEKQPGKGDSYTIMKHLQKEDHVHRHACQG